MSRANSYLRSNEFRDLLDQTRGDGSYEAGWQGFLPIMLQFAARTDKPRLLEIGGGRRPLLSREDTKALGCSYTVNDIDAGELEQAPEWVGRLLGDIADPQLVTSDQRHKYDVIFSVMVFEHVSNPQQAYRNISELLAPGGIVINFVPTLFAAPFVVNRLLPERLTAKVVQAAFPTRNQHGVPKFPAYYRWCTTTGRMDRRLGSVGFSEWKVVPFYGHQYYTKVPVLRSFAGRVWPQFARRDWRMLSTYAYVIAEAGRPIDTGGIGRANSAATSAH